MTEILKISFIAFMVSAILQQDQSLLSWYHKAIARLPWYLCKPLGGCYKYFVGQVCLWYFIFTKPFNLIELAFFVTAGIAASMVYHFVYCFLNESRSN